MLTSTYTLVALSVEQTTVRAALQSLLDELRALPGDFSTLAAGRAAQMCAALRQAYDNCHWRKLDKFLVPALRRSTAAADALLAELERLSSQAAAAMSTAEACVGAADRPVQRDRFCGAVECCVAALRRRLEREEHELFPLARAAVGGDAWFAIANQMLAHDAHAQEHRGDARRLRHELIGHDGHEVHERDPLQPESGCRNATLTVAH
ncbi:hemerythrin domain-containing protein [Massilia putida]|uniref:hemerythrin domain-containing protein n=1 Tax=Massilia putida TaxID=1141883 RepID=UPI0009535423|nr:hemerythrin domain-containing protein [Massilia putida]